MATRAKALPRGKKAKVLRLTAVYTPCAEGGFMGEILEGNALFTQGETLDETRENLFDVVRTMLEISPTQVGTRRGARRSPAIGLMESLFVILP